MADDTQHLTASALDLWSRPWTVEENPLQVELGDLSTTIVNLAESGYVVNVIASDVILENVIYDYVKDVGLVATDKRGFILNINEFGTKS